MSELRDDKKMAEFKAKIIDTLSPLPPGEAAVIYRKLVDSIKDIVHK